MTTDWMQRFVYNDDLIRLDRFLRPAAYESGPHLLEFNTLSAMLFGQIADLRMMIGLCYLRGDKQ
jgi:hypothetical protein